MHLDGRTTILRGTSPKKTSDLKAHKNAWTAKKSQNQARPKGQSNWVKKEKDKSAPSKK